MPNYALLRYNDPSSYPDDPAQWGDGIEACGVFVAQAEKIGAKVVGGSPLAKAFAAKTVRVGQEPVVTDGPFAETKEQLGGYYLIEAADDAMAIEVAKLIGDECVEVRPIPVLPA
jgi:hypothetical protein